MRSHYLRAGAGGGEDGWEILMATRVKTHQNGNTAAYGYTGSSAFRSISGSYSSTDADSRTTATGGLGLYYAFFNKTGITKIALADTHGGGSGLEPTTNFSKYIVYDLVATTTKTIYNTLLDLDTYNINNYNWAGQDGPFGADSVDNFVAGNYESGNMSANSGHYYASDGNTPDKFVIWGINRDSDNDTQTLCAYSGNLQSGKSDSWRGNTPAQTFWSYWGNDWHSNSQSQTISQGKQTDPGYNGNASGVSDPTIMYLLAF